MASSRSLFSSNSSYDSGNFTYSGCTDEGCWNLSPPITIPPLPNQTDPDPAKIHIHHSSRLLLYSLVTAASLFALSFILLLISYFLLRLRRRRRHRRRLLQSNSQIQNHPPPFPFQDPDLLDGDDGDGGTHHIWYIRTVGLDESVIKSIAAAVYKSGDGLIDGGDCTVCLGEFVEGEVIKLLPKCSHAFHQSCIDMWLRSHVNCPLCRAPVVVVGPAESEGSVSGAVAVASEETAPVTNGEGGGEEECVVVVDLEAGSSSSNSRREGAENDNENENELQPIRRSVSMDSSSLGVLMLRVHLTEEEEKLGEEKKQAELQGAAASKNGGKGSESFRKWGMEMKRSLSSRSGRMFFTRNARARGRSSSVLPL